MTVLSDLPDEILLLIAESLPTDYIFSLRFVSRKFNRVFSSDYATTVAASKWFPRLPDAERELAMERMNAVLAGRPTHFTSINIPFFPSRQASAAWLDVQQAGSWLMWNEDDMVTRILNLRSGLQYHIASTRQQVPAVDTLAPYRLTDRLVATATVRTHEEWNSTLDIYIGDLGEPNLAFEIISVPWVMGTLSRDPHVDKQVAEKWCVAFAKYIRVTQTIRIVIYDRRSKKTFQHEIAVSDIQDFSKFESVGIDIMAGGTALSHYGMTLDTDTETITFHNFDVYRRGEDGEETERHPVSLVYSTTQYTLSGVRKWQRSTLRSVAPDSGPEYDKILVGDHVRKSGLDDLYSITFGRHTLAHYDKVKGTLNLRISQDLGQQIWQHTSSNSLLWKTRLFECKSNSSNGTELSIHREGQQFGSDWKQMRAWRVPAGSTLLTFNDSYVVFYGCSALEIWTFDSTTCAANQLALTQYREAGNAVVKEAYSSPRTRGQWVTWPPVAWVQPHATPPQARSSHRFLKWRTFSVAGLQQLHEVQGLNEPSYDESDDEVNTMLSELNVG